MVLGGGGHYFYLVARNKKCQVTVVHGMEETVTHNTAVPFPVSLIILI